MRLWGADGTPLVETEAHASTVTGVAWNSTGKQLATCSYGGVHVWNVALEDEISGLTWEPEGRSLAAVDGAGHVGCWQPLP